MPELYYAKGKLEVTARGYWFTSGGEKGSFGYYPHLKESNLPVYPDTQIHGDLRMAVSWLLKLKGKDLNDVKKYFGDSPDNEFRDSKSKVFITDLKPLKDAEFEFQVKPRTEIDECRTNKEHMLVNLECAHFKDTLLTADIYLAYFHSEEELKELIELITEAVHLLSGFGAFRSRGFGRGDVRVCFETITCCKEENLAQNSGDVITLILKPLVNFRNKEIEPGKRQLLEASNFISSAQFRGWFVKTYKDFFGVWPTTEEMKSITFTDFYPSLYDNENNECALGYPPPVTTVKFENGDIVDMWKDGDEDKPNEIKQKDGRTKPKPLGARYFVTNEASSRLIELKTDKRMRNSINPNFATKEEGGLFAQEFVRVDNYFGGIITITDKNHFTKNALQILCNKDIKPVINGAIFEKFLCKPPVPVSSDNDKPFLVFSAIDWDKETFGIIKEPTSCSKIRITTRRSYNMELKRPRRNRIVVMPGSILSTAKDCKTINWQGFGREIIVGIGKEGKAESAEISIHQTQGEAMKMSRSQAGQLKEFLSPIMSKELMGKLIGERLKKYKNWQMDANKINERLIPEKVFKDLEQKLAKDGLKKAQEYIKELLDNYKLTQWEESKERILREFKKLAKEKGYQNE